MTILNSNFTDLKTELDISDVWNEVRVLLPSYSYTLELIGGVWTKIPINYVQRDMDGASVVKYGRRTKTFSKHTIDDGFGEAYCTSQVARYKEPMTRIELKLIGSDATKTVTCLNTKISDQITYIYSAIGLNDTGIVGNLTLDVDSDGIPCLTLSIAEARAIELLNLFHIDVDLIDGEHVIG